MLPRYRVDDVNKEVISKKKSDNKRKTTEQYKEELAIYHPDVEVLEEYINARTKIKHKHKICGTIWSVTPDSILRGTGCPKCAIKINAKNRTLSDSQFKNKINNSITILSEYVNNHTPVICQCKICSHTWNSRPSDLMQGKGCPNCAGNIKKTHEQFIQDVMDKLNHNVIIIGTYKGANIPIECKCRTCETEFLSMPYRLKLGNGCKKCADKLNGLLKRNTHDQFINKLTNINKNIKVLGTYTTANSKIQVQCKICNYIWEPISSSLLSGNGCPKCANQITISHNDFLERIKDSKNKNITIIGEYVDSKTPIKCSCNMCGNIFYAIPHLIKNGSGCKKCVSKEQGISKRKSHQDYVKELQNINKNIKVIGEYTTAQSHISVQCLLCENIWNPIADSLLRGNGCPYCKTSKLETLTEEYLKGQQINYDKNAKYKELIGFGNRQLSYDFYLPQYNLLIECQGEQHEHPVEYFGGIKKYVIQKIHDTRKRKYAHDHNINLLEIWYYEKTKINKILEQTLNNLKSESLTTAG